MALTSDRQVLTDAEETQDKDDLHPEGSCNGLGLDMEQERGWGTKTGQGHIGRNYEDEYSGEEFENPFNRYRDEEKDHVVIEEPRSRKPSWLKTTDGETAVFGRCGRNYGALTSQSSGQNVVRDGTSRHGLTFSGVTSRWQEAEGERRGPYRACCDCLETCCMMTFCCCLYCLDLFIK